MEQDLRTTVALLARFPAALNALLRDLPEAWTLANEGGNTWTAFDIVGHLIYLEQHHWIPRLKTVLEFGESRPLASVDRWAQTRESQGKTLVDLLDEFTRLRTANLAELEAMELAEENFDRRGVHPALGVITLSQVLATWATHDLTHLHQLSRVLAYQYRDAVGPWGQYLGVLKCNTHKDS